MSNHPFVHTRIGGGMQRRAFLKAASAFTFAAVLSPAARAAAVGLKLKIIDVKLRRVPPGEGPRNALTASGTVDWHGGSVAQHGRRGDGHRDSHRPGDGGGRSRRAGAQRRFSRGFQKSYRRSATPWTSAVWPSIFMPVLAALWSRSHCGICSARRPTFPSTNFGGETTDQVMPMPARSPWARPRNALAWRMTVKAAGWEGNQAARQV